VSAPADTESVSALQTAWRQTLAGATIGFGGDLIGATITLALGRGGLGNMLRFAHAGLCLAVMLALIAGRRRLSLRSVLMLFVLLVLPVYALIPVWTAAVPEAQLSESFIAYKMAIMALALLTPSSLLLGLALVGAFTAEAVVTWCFGLAGHLPSEPWITLFYGAFAAGLLVHRASERALSRRLWRAHAEAAALERLARVSLEVRDQVNTPLQTLELGLDLLARRCPKELTVVERLRHAVTRLSALSARLTGDGKRG
jgi:hypothetical protein